MANFNLSFVWQAVDKFSPTVKNIKRNMSALQKQTAGLSTQIRDSSRVFTGAFLGMSAAIGGSVFAAAKFEEGMTNIYTLLSKEDLKRFKGDLDNASLSAIKMGFSLEDTTKGLFDTQSAIGNVEKTIKVYDISQKLAIGGVTTLAIAVDGLTSIINAYGKETVKATDVANAFFSAQKAGKTTVALLASNIGKVAPIAKQAGIDFKTLLALMSQLTLSGLRTEEATTALRGAIVGLISPTTEAQLILKEKGIAFGAAALQGTNFIDVLEKIAKVAEKDKDLLAKMITETRALTAVSALGVPQLKSVRNIVSSINIDIKKGTGLNEAYAEQMKTFNRRFAIAKQSIFLMGRSFGVFLLPILGKVLIKFSKLTDAITNLSPQVKKTILVIGSLVAAFTGLVAITGAWLIMKPAVLAALAVISKSFAAFWIAVTGPIGLVTAAVIGLALLGIKLYKSWLPFKRVVDFVVEKLKEFSASRIGRIVTAGLGPVGLPLKLLGGLGGARGVAATDVRTEAGLEARIKIEAPPGVVKSTVVKTTGASENVGLNMVEATA